MFKTCLTPAAVSGAWLCLLAASLGAGCAGRLTPPTIKSTPLPIEAWSHPPTVADSGVRDLLALAVDPQIRSFVVRAVEGNLNLQQTALRLQESGVLLRVSKAERLPALDVTSSVRREGGSSSGSATSLGAGFQLSWEIDLWGRLADRQRSAKLQDLALREDYRAAQNSLAARTMQAILERTYRIESLEISQRRLESLEVDLEIIAQRYSRGLGSLIDRDAARSSRSSASADVIDRREQVAVVERRLTSLVGHVPENLSRLPTELPPIAQPAVALPGDVLARRPDVASGLARVTSDLYGARAARRALLPSFSLRANATIDGPTAGDLLRADPVWSLLGNLIAPLFDHGRRRAEAQAAEWAAERSYLAYRETLLTATLEVENALGAETSLTTQLEDLESASEYAALSLQSFRQQYRRGLVDIIDLLIAQRTAFAARQRLLDARFAWLINRIDLGLALGLNLITT